MSVKAIWPGMKAARARAWFLFVLSMMLVSLPSITDAAGCAPASSNPRCANPVMGPWSYGIFNYTQSTWPSEAALLQQEETWAYTGPLTACAGSWQFSDGGGAYSEIVGGPNVCQGGTLQGYAGAATYGCRGDGGTLNHEYWDYYADGSPPCSYHMDKAFLFYRQRSVACPEGYSTTGFGPNDTCVADGTLIPNKTPACGVGNPIEPGCGFKTQSEVDYVASRALTSKRVYRSEITKAKQYGPNPFGTGWSHNLISLRIVFSKTPSATATTLYVHRPDGRVLIFNIDATGNVWTDADTVDRVAKFTDGNGIVTWQFTDAADDAVETYDSNGLLLTKTWPDGSGLAVHYDTANRPDRFTDEFGRALVFGYDTSNRVHTMTDLAGQTYTYDYDANGKNNLEKVTYPDNNYRQYFYGEAAYGATNFPNALTGIQDELGQRYATFQYDSSGVAIGTWHAGEVDKFSVDYDAVGLSTTIQTPLGATLTLSLQNILGVPRWAGSSDPCPMCGMRDASVEYDAATGTVLSRTDFLGYKTCYWYNNSRNLESTRVEGLTASESCGDETDTPPSRPDVRQITTTWHATYRRPATITEPAPGGTSKQTFTYENGNLKTKSITAPNNGTDPNQTRSWGWTYKTYGRVATATDPNGKQTTYSYYGDDTSCTGIPNACGRLWKVSQPVTGTTTHDTILSDYDADGRPHKVTDPNNVDTLLDYWPRGWLKWRQIGGELTQYEYDQVGQLKKVILPDNSWVQYTYDDAHRLTQVEDSQANKIVYTVDLMGNRTKEEVFAAGVTGPVQKRFQIFDEFGRLHQTVGAQ